jgi:hypothetical protein
LGLFLSFSRVDLMFCRSVLSDEAMASWENFCCFLFYKSVYCFKVGGFVFVLKFGSLLKFLYPYV